MFYKKRIEELERLVEKMRVRLDAFVGANDKKTLEQFKHDKFEEALGLSKKQEAQAGSRKKGKPKVQKSRKRITTSRAFRRRVNEFLMNTDIPKAEFAQRARISYGTVYNALQGKRMNKATVARISLFMDRHSNF